MILSRYILASPWMILGVSIALACSCASTPPILKMIAAEDEAGVAKLVQSAKFDPNAYGALASAVRKGNERIVSILIERGASVAILAKSDDSKAAVGLLRLAVESRHDNLIAALLKAGAPVDLAGSDWKTALQAALELKRAEAVSLLVEAGASFKEPAVFASAIAGDSAEVATKYLALGGDPNASLHTGALPLQAALSSKSWSVAELLVSRGALVDATVASGRSLLAFALDGDNLEAAAFLVRKGAKTSGLKDSSGVDPVAAAAEAGKKDKVGLLLDMGFSAAGIKSSKGEPLLPAVSSKGDFATASLLLHAGADPEGRDRAGKRALDYALAKQAKDFAGELVEFGSGLEPFAARASDLIAEYQGRANSELVKAAVIADAATMRYWIGCCASIADSGAASALANATMPDSYLDEVRKYQANIDKLNANIQSYDGSIRYYNNEIARTRGHMAEEQSAGKPGYYSKYGQSDINDYQNSINKVNQERSQAFAQLNIQNGALQKAKSDAQSRWDQNRGKCQATIKEGESPRLAETFGKANLDAIRSKCGARGLVAFFAIKGTSATPLARGYDATRAAYALRYGEAGYDIAEAYREGTDAAMAEAGPALLALVLRRGPSAFARGRPSFPPLPVAEVSVDRSYGFAEHPVVTITVANKGKGDLYDLRALVSSSKVAIGKDRSSLALGYLKAGAATTRAFVAPALTLADLLGGDVDFGFTFSEQNDNIPRDCSAVVKIAPLGPGRAAELARLGLLGPSDLAILVTKLWLSKADFLTLLKNGDMAAWPDALIAYKVSDGEAEEVMTARRESLSMKDFARLAGGYSISTPFYEKYLTTKLDAEASDYEAFLASGKLGRSFLQKYVLSYGDRIGTGRIVAMAKKGIVSRETVDRLIRGEIVKFSSPQLLELFNSSSVSSSVVAYEIETGAVLFTKDTVLAMAQAGCLGRQSMNRLVRDGDISLSRSEIAGLQKAGKLDEVAVGFSAKVLNDETATIPGPGDGIARLGESFDFVIKLTNTSIFALKDSRISVSAEDKDLTLYQNVGKIAKMGADESASFTAVVQPSRKFAKDSVPLRVTLDNPDFGTLVSRVEAVPLSRKEPEIVTSLAKRVVTVSEAPLRSGASAEASVLANLSPGVSLEATGKTSTFYRVRSIGNETAWIEATAVKDQEGGAAGEELRLKDSVHAAWDDRGVYAVASVTGVKPEVEIVEPADASVVKSDRVLVTVRAVDRASGIGALRLEVNGKSVPDSSQRRGLQVAENPYALSRTFEVKLSPGKNELSAVAINKKLEKSYPASVVLESAPQPSGGKLWVLAVGIGDYRLPSQRLGLAAKDARTFASLFAGQKGVLYGDVSVMILADAQATARSMKAAIADFLGKAEPEDTVVFFYAGHGIVGSDGKYYLVSWDADMSDQASLSSKGFGRDELASTFSRNVQAEKILLFLDSCQSGELARKGGSADSEIDNLQRSFGKFIMTASRGAESALENQAWGNGALTKAIREALAEGKADYDKSGTIGADELKMYVSARVAELTGDKQHPNTQNAFVEPFALFSVK